MSKSIIAIIFFFASILCLSTFVVATEYCDYFGVNRITNAVNATVKTDRCVYSGSSGTISFNVTAGSYNITGANLSVATIFPSSASEVAPIEINNSNNFELFIATTDSTFTLNASASKELRINYTVAAGFNSRFNISVNITGNFTNTSNSLTIVHEAVISCNRPASGDWTLNSSEVGVCENVQLTDISNARILVVENATLIINNSNLYNGAGGNSIELQNNASAIIYNTIVNDDLTFRDNSTVTLTNLTTATISSITPVILINNTNTTIISGTFGQSSASLIRLYGQSRTSIQGATFSVNTNLTAYERSYLYVGSSTINGNLYIKEKSNLTLNLSTTTSYLELSHNTSAWLTGTGGSSTLDKLVIVAQTNISFWNVEPSDSLTAIINTTGSFFVNFSSQNVSNMQLILNSNLTAKINNSRLSNISLYAGAKADFFPTSVISSITQLDGISFVNGTLNLTNTDFQNGTLTRFFQYYMQFQNNRSAPNVMLMVQNKTTSANIVNYTTDSNGIVEMNYSYASATKNLNYTVYVNSTLMADISLLSSTPVNVTLNDATVPVIGNFNLSTAYFGQQSPINTSPLIINVNMSDDLSIYNYSYIVYDYSDNFTCLSLCFNTTTVSYTNETREERSQWQYIFHISNGTQFPVNITIDGLIGNISGKLDYDGNSTTYTPQAVTLQAFNITGRIINTSFINSTGNRIAFSTNTSVFNFTDYFGNAWGVTLTDLFNVSNSIHDGIYYINLTIEDTAGNKVVQTKGPVYIDTTIPTLTVATLSDNYIANGTAVALSLNITDATSVTVTATGYTLTNYTNKWNGTATISNIDGNHSINISVTDLLNNTLNTTINYTIDNINPNITSISAIPFIVTNSTNVTYIVELNNESNTSIETVTAESNSIEWNGTIWIGYGSADMDGNFDITVTDKAGNSITNSSVTYTTDTELPSISITVNGTTTNPITTNDTTVIFNATDNINLSHLKYIFDANLTTILNTSAGSNSSSYILKLNLTVGMHNLTVYANDTANNAYYNSVLFYSSKALNFSDWNETIKNNLAGNATSFVLTYSNGTAIESDVSETVVNRSYTLNFTTYTDAIKASFSSFNGLKANWGKYFHATDNEQTSKNNIKENLTADVKYMVYVNMSDFLADESSYQATIDFPLNVSLYTSLWYFEDEAKLNYTNVTSCNPTFNGVDPCYTIVTNTRSFVYLPHMSMLTVNNDTTGPNITVTYIPNATIYNDSASLYYNITTTESATCSYAGSGSPAGAIEPKNMTALDDARKNFYTAAEDNLTNASLYTITFTCTDEFNNSNTKVIKFKVNDTIVPTVTSISGPQAGTTIKSLTLTAITHEPATCRYATTDTTYQLMSNLTEAATISHSRVFNYSADTSGTFYIRCEDRYKNIMTTSSTFEYTVTIDEEDSDDDGGGGGGGGSSTPPAGPSKTQIWTVVEAGKTNYMRINNQKIPVENLSFVLKGNVTNVEITLKSLDTLPESVTSFTGTAYKYLDISTKKMLDDDFQEAKLRFNVPQSWIDTNYLHADNLALYRLVKDWVELETEISSITNTTIYYEAVLPGFSYFAISTKIKQITYTAFDIIDIIRNFYQGSSTHTSFEIIDIIRNFYSTL